MLIGLEAKEKLEQNIGLTLDQIQSMSLDEQIAYVEAKTGKSMGYSYDRNPTKVARGNPALGRGRYKTMNQINNKIDSIVSLTKIKG